MLEPQQITFHIALIALIFPQPQQILLQSLINCSDFCFEQQQMIVGKKLILLKPASFFFIRISSQIRDTVCFVPH